MDAKSRSEPSASTSRAPRVRAAPSAGASMGTSKTSGMKETTTPGIPASSKPPMRSGSSSASGSAGSGLASKIRAPSTHPRPHVTPIPNPRSHANTTLESSHRLPRQTQKSHTPQTGGELGDSADGESKDGDSDEVMRVYERFRALGMPEGVSFEAFGRIMGGGVGEGEDEKKRMPLNSRSRGRDQQQEEKQEEEEGRGDWNTALTFLSTHLVGRQEAMKARGLISRARAELANPSALHSGASGIKAPVSVVSGDKLSDLLVDPMAVAARKREMAYRALEAARREWEGVSKDVRVLDAQRKTLANRVAERRRVLLLLGVLERREEVRVRRLGVREGGMGALLAELGKRSALAMREFEELVVSSKSLKERVVIPNATRLRERVGRYRNTTEALAKLHAHHLAATRDGGAAGGSGTGGPGIGMDSGAVGRDVEERLENVLRRLGLEGKALDKMKKNLRVVASRRAEARSIGIGGKGEDERRLEALVRANEAKRRQVQEKINRAVGLGWLCEEHIELISTFRNETAKDLGTMLDEESRRVLGYVDTLRESIMQQREKESEVIVNDVREALGVDRVRSIADASPGLDVEVKVNTELMERKGRKADHGFALAAEIKAFLVDTRRLTGWP